MRELKKKEQNPISEQRLQFHINLETYEILVDTENLQIRTTSGPEYSQIIHELSYFSAPSS
jgi:hypothetical protein